MDCLHDFYIRVSQPHIRTKTLNSGNAWKIIMNSIIIYYNHIIFSSKLVDYDCMDQTWNQKQHLYCVLYWNKEWCNWDSLLF